jgi:hypothetical protein
MIPGEDSFPTQTSDSTPEAPRQLRDFFAGVPELPTGIPILRNSFVDRKSR